VTPRSGGTVVIASSQEPACLNLLRVACRNGLLPALNQVLEGGYEVGPKLTYRENLISSGDVTKKPYTVTYHIRPEARWSDGVPVTAGDFSFTYRAMSDHKTGQYPWERILSVRALGKKTLRVVFREPEPDWRGVFRWVLPRHAFAGEDPEAIWRDTLDNPKTGEPIGSGPFLVQRFERGQRLVLVRNPRYWGPHQAYLDRLVFRFVAPDAYADALRRGDVDLIEAGTPFGAAAALELQPQTLPGIGFIRGQGAAWTHLEIRMGPGGHPALKKGLVRQALAYGIDRQAIAQAVLGELYEDQASIKPLDSAVLLMNQPGYQANWKSYRYRPAEASRLLGRAGCRRGGDGIYSCGDERLLLRLVTTAGTEARERALRLVQSQLRGVGVDSELAFRPPAVFFDTVPHGDFDLALFSWVHSAGLGGPYFVFRCQGENNYTGYCDRLVTRDLVQSVRILDRGRRVQVLNKADAKLAKAVPAIPLFQNAFLVAFSKRVRGLVANATDEGFTWNSEDWWLSR
jgi:peptide/nickel transport system substrate-binding protein